MGTRPQYWWEPRISCSWLMPRALTSGLFGLIRVLKNPDSYTPDLALPSSHQSMKLWCKGTVWVSNSTSQPHAKGKVVLTSTIVGDRIFKKARCDPTIVFDLVIIHLSIGFSALQKANVISPRHSTFHAGAALSPCRKAYSWSRPTIESESTSCHPTAIMLWCNPALFFLSWDSQQDATRPF